MTLHDTIVTLRNAHRRGHQGTPSRLLRHGALGATIYRYCYELVGQTTNHPEERVRRLVLSKKYASSYLLQMHYYARRHIRRGSNIIVLDPDIVPVPLLKRCAQVHVIRLEPHHITYARKLARQGVCVHLRDVARLPDAVRRSDDILLWCTEISSRGALASRGGELLSLLAHANHVPVTVFVPSWAWTHHNVTPETQRFNVRVPRCIIQHNQSTDVVTHITHIISDIGIHSPNKLYRAIQKSYPWI